MKSLRKFEMKAVVTVSAAHSAAYSSQLMWACVLHLDSRMFRKDKIDGAASVGDQRTVLIVDDDADSREALAQVVETEGYQVFQAENGQQAVDWIEAVPPPPGLILLDLEMPVMDGREFLAHLPTLPYTTKPAVIVITGQNPGRIVGATSVLRKPVAITQLLGLMQRLMPLPERTDGIAHHGP
jgi:two-component system response regulator CpxR